MAFEKTSKEVLELTRITKKRIQELCKRDKLYQTPELNDVLYLHYQGFDCIECLDDYTELKCLWLECNAISEIQGLSKQAKLKCLFLQSNMIRKIENLEYCKQLDTLNLSQNHIRKIENCDFEVLPVLNTLNLASNYLKDCESLKALVDCRNLSVLDLSNNRIDDILVVKIFSQMPELKVLILQGNPVVSKIPQYRKTLILECKKLTYLDSRPVFPKERACAVAWKRGGYAEERKENERWNRKERKKMRDSVNVTIDLRNRHRKLEDQISRIPSSDSEEETNPQKKNIKIDVHSEASAESIWDEVTDDQNLNNYSISNNDNQDENCADFSMKVDNKEEETNDALIKDRDNAEVVEHHKIGEQPNILEISQSDLQANKFLRQQEKHASNDNLKEFEKDLKNEQFQPQDKIQITTLKEFNDRQELNRNSPQNSLSEAEDLKTIKHSEFDKEISTPSDSAADECNTAGKTFYDNHQLFKELKETINVFSQEVNYYQGSCNLEKKAENSDKINLNELEEKQEQQEQRQEIKNIFSSKYTTGKECSFVSAASDGNSIALKSNRCNNQLVMKNKLLNCPGETATVSKADNYIKHGTVDPESEGEKNMAHNKSTLNLEYVPMDNSSLTRKSNEPLISFEAESQALKTLLEKLENRTECVFKGKTWEEKNEKADSCWKNFETNLKLDLVDNDHAIFIQNREKNIFRGDCNVESMSHGFEEVEVEVVTTILEEIIQSLDIVDLMRNSNDLTQYENTPKTLPEVTVSFNQLLPAINTTKRTKEKIPCANSDKQIPLDLKEFSQNPTALQYFNNDTLQTLNAQLAKIRKNKHKKVWRMVDRIYAQKDRYNDTIELIDNKLMVRNQVTKELQELSHKPPSSETSDSEDSYDTALSEADETTIHAKFKPFKPKPRKSSVNIIFKAFEKNEQTTSSDESEDSSGEFYSLGAQEEASLYEIDRELFKNLTFDLTNLTKQDENYIVQCATSYEELKHCFTLNEKESSLAEPEKKLLENKGKINCDRADPQNLQIDTEERSWFQKKYFGEDEQQTIQFENYFDKTVTKNNLTDTSESQESKESQHETKSEESFLSDPKESEEEKNEIENNADIKKEAEYKKILEGKDSWEILNSKLHTVEEENNEQSSEQTAHDASKTQIIECSLEIMDTITVNADTHFE